MFLSISELRDWETERQKGKAISFYIDIYPYIGETIVSAWACIHIERPKFVRYDSTVYQSLWVRNRAFIVASKQFASTFVQRVYKCTLNRNKQIVQGEHNSCTIKWIGAYFLDGYKCFIMLGIFVIISSFVLLSLVWLCVMRLWTSDICIIWIMFRLKSSLHKHDAWRIVPKI